MNELQSLDFTLKSTFEKISDFFVNYGYEINNLGFLLLQKKMGQVSINCLKIKITSKCTRKCSYCIFSDNREQDLSFEKFKLIIEKFKSIHVNKIFINGGEPTLHPSLELMGKYLKERFPSKELIIGTNCTIISKSNKIFQIVTKYFDTFAIGCDDEHRNFEDVEKIVPKIRSLGKTVVVNTLIDFISSDNKLALDEFCKNNGIIHVYNNLHHFCVGKKNKIGKICSKLTNINLMITRNGDCFRCFNAVDEKLPEFNINDKDCLERVFQKRKQHYNFCYYCDEYSATNESNKFIVPSKPVNSKDNLLPGAVKCSKARLEQRSQSNKRAHVTANHT